MTEDRFGISRPLIDEHGRGPLGFSRPLAKGRVMRLHGEVQRAVDDEASAGDEYRNIAALAEELGYDGIAEDFRSAANDEDRHLETFRKNLQKLERDIE